MDTLFHEYFSKYNNKENMWNLVGGFNVEPDEQMILEMNAMCVAQRVFVERFQRDEEGLLASLKLFRFPPDTEPFKERMNRLPFSGWQEVWIAHLKSLKPFYDLNKNTKTGFANYMIYYALCWSDWMNKDDDIFLKLSAQDGFEALAVFIRECCEGLYTKDKLMRELKEEGFDPKMEVYQSYRKLLNELGIK